MSSFMVRSGRCRHSRGGREGVVIHDEVGKVSSFMMRSGRYRHS